MGGVMAIESSKAAPGTTILASLFNKLRNDVLKNHDHSSGQGTVDHADLADSGPMSSVYHDHGNIETHMNGSDGSFDDSGGGEQGVHGLGSGIRVCGVLGKTVDGVFTAGQAVILYGSETSPPTSGSVSFGTVFDVPPIVIPSYVKGEGNVRDQGWRIYTVTTEGFEYSFEEGDAPSEFHYIAIGVKT